MTIEELQERFNELRGKKWRTVIGHVKAEFIGFIFGSAYPFFIQLETGEVHTVDLNLFFYNDSSHPYIEEDTPYADWPIDAKIWVWDTGSEKMKRHFAGVADNGKPKAFLNGYSSWSAPLQTNEWDHAELAED
jgi:hypothetical protein